MAKIPYNKLKFKTKSDINIVELNIDDIKYEIEVKSYLSVSEKLNIIEKVINLSSNDEINFYNPLQLEFYLGLEILYNYTNLSFTDTTKNDPIKLYDEVVSNGLLDKIIEVLEKTGEYKILTNVLYATVDSVYKFQNSVMGILTTISNNYNETADALEDLQSQISNPENLTLLKDVLTKLG